MCKYNFFFIRTFVEQCSAAMACILDDFGLPSDCVVVVFVVLHLVRVRWGAKFQPLSRGKKGRRMYYDCWECWLWRGGCMTFQIICMILFSFHILKRVDFFIFIPALFFFLFKITFAFVWMLFVCVLFRRWIHHKKVFILILIHC